MRAIRIASISTLVVASAACSGQGAPSSSEVVLPAPTDEPAKSSATVATFEGSFDPARGLHVVMHALDGTVSTQATLPYGTSAGNVYFHTCSTTSNASTVGGMVSAVNLMTSTVHAMNAYIDSVSSTNVTLGSGPSSGSPPPGVIMQYGDVPPNSAGQCANQHMWTFNDPGLAPFSFKGHADGLIASCVDTSGGLVAWYPMDGDLSDALALGATGTLSAGTTFTTDKNGHASSALSFNGASFASFNDTQLPVGGSARSISLWFYSTNASFALADLFNYGTHTTAQRFGLLVASTGTNREYFVGENRDVPGTTPWSLGVWHNAIVTYVGTTSPPFIKVYFDGVATNATKNWVLGTVGTGVVLGRSILAGQGEFFPGNLDDFRAYNRVLTAAEITCLFNAGPQ